MSAGASSRAPEATPGVAELPDASDARRERLRRRVAGATVVVLTGGTSSEREIALLTGRGVADALAAAPDGRASPARVVTVEIEPDGRWRLPDAAPRAPGDALAALPGDALFFLALHGGEGENGVVQGFLQLSRRTYTGAGVAASALCMDKQAARDVLAAAGLRTAPAVCIDAAAWSSAREASLAAARALGPRAYVKPNAGGSSVSTFRVADEDALAAAVDAVVATGDRALVEAEVVGVEATCGVLGNAGGELRALPPVEIVPHAGRFFDYEEKYRAGGAEEHCPPRTLSTGTVERLRELALAAHRATRCDGYSRTDFIVPRDAGGTEGEPVVLEVNTLPGLTERSLFPQSMRAAGTDYRAMCLALLELAVMRHEEPR